MPQHEAKCAHCGRAYIAFRSTSQYCGKYCCNEAWNLKHPSIRPAVLERDKHTCGRCGAAEGKMFVRVPKGMDRTVENAKTLCGRCHWAESQRLFHLRVPNGERGRNYRRNIAARTQEDDVCDKSSKPPG